MIHDGQHCASLPISRLSVTIWYCAHHQGYFAMYDLSVQNADESQAVEQTSESFGPFYTATDVLEWYMNHGAAVPRLRRLTE